MITAAVLGVLAVWNGIVLAYDSYYWPPAAAAGRSASSWWPWSCGYLLTFLRRRPAGPHPDSHDPEHACSPA